MDEKRIKKLLSLSTRGHHLATTLSRIDHALFIEAKQNLYDPEDNDLDINMWSNSNGDQLKVIFSKLNEINLSEDASEIMRILLLTNAYPPKRNISEKEFLKFKSNWLIKNSDLDLIEEYIIKNQILNKNGFKGMKVTIVSSEINEKLALSSRNVPYVSMVKASSCSVRDLYDNDVIIIDVSGLEVLSSRFGDKN